MRSSLIVAVAAAMLGALLVPGRQVAVADPAPDLSRAELAGAWIAREAEDGSLPGPSTRTDWGLTIDALFALYAAGSGESAAERMTAAIESNAGTYLGPDLYRDEDVRIAGSAAALLNVAVITGGDPHSFGHGRYAGPGDAYDIRDEVLDLIAPPGSDQPGRIQDRGTGSDSTNTFSQSLAVIGLARSGGGHEPALAFLRTQQCEAGYFRMFYNDGKSCDAAGGRPDIDGTAIATQALMAARAAGTGGLDGAINRASAWLRSVQRPDGSFGGVGSSEPPNANTTGLAAQALHATGATAAYRKARRWVKALQVTPRRADGTAIASDVGAFAYDPDALAEARRSGIDEAGRDQWRRATTQAVFAVAPVPYGRLGTHSPTGNPRVPEVAEGEPDEQPDPRDDETDPPDEEPVPEEEPAPEDESAPEDAPAPEDESTDAEDAAEAETAPEPTRPTARAAAFIAGRLVDGTHVEVRQDGTRYVDYDTTADAVLALRILGERPAAARTATRFLLREQSIDAYVHGKPYEKPGATYAEPLAKLSLIAQWLPSTKRARELAEELTRLQNARGGFDDRGKQSDRSMSTRRQAWAALALRAAGLDKVADRAVRPIAAVQCADGSFATDLTQTDCSTGAPSATGLSVQAINAVRAGDAGVRAYTTAASETASADHAASLRAVAGYLAAYGSKSGALAVSTRADLVDWPAASAVAAGRQAVGLDATYVAIRAGRLLGSDGGVGRTRNGVLQATIAAAPAIAGRSLLGVSGSPLAPGSRVPVGADQVEPVAAAVDDEPVVARWVVYGLAGLLALVLLLTIVLLMQRILRRPEVDKA